MVSDFSFLISNMTWSYSRLKVFETCPYGFFLKYILEEDEDDTFLASYGRFVHEIHEKVYKGVLRRSDAAAYYLENFHSSVAWPPPSAEVLASYYRNGYTYFQNMFIPKGEITAVEQKVSFSVHGLPFRGAIDLITKTKEGLAITDHKARRLKPYSGRKKPTKADQELDDYFRQLYLYAEAVHQNYGVYPSLLNFNCYRNQVTISKRFAKKELDQVLSWAANLASQIMAQENWLPDIDYFKCKNLCGLGSCDYRELM